MDRCVYFIALVDFLVIVALLGSKDLVDPVSRIIAIDHLKQAVNVVFEKGEGRVKSDLTRAIERKYRGWEWCNQRGTCSGFVQNRLLSIFSLVGWF